MPKEHKYVHDEIATRVVSIVGWINADKGQQYSKEKFEKMMEFKSSAWSTLKACVSLCLMALLPSAVLLLPFNDPSAGILANPSVLIAGNTVSCISAIAFNVRHGYIFTQSRFSTKTQIMAVLLFMSLNTTAWIVLALTLGFPVPFTSISTGTWGVIGFMVFCYFHVEKQQREKLKRTFILMQISFLTLFVHEGIGVLYTNQHGSEWGQTTVAMLLPIAKFSLRFIQMRFFKHFEEGLSICLVVFEVEFFNSIYMSVFLQTTTSPFTIFGLVIVDVVENALFLYRLHKEARKCHSHIQLLGLLYRTEMIVLIEFVEVLVPIIQAIFVLVFRQSANRQYSELYSQQTEEEFYASLYNLLFLTCMELASLVILVLVLRYRHYVPVIRQLGFAVHQYQWLIVSTMGAWMLLSFLQTFPHFGNDYKFQFTWLMDPNERTN